MVDVLLLQKVLQSISLVYANYCIKSRFFNQYFQLKMKRLYLDNMKVTQMIQQFLTTPTLQHLQLLFSVYIMKDGKVVLLFVFSSYKNFLVAQPQKI